MLHHIIFRKIDIIGTNEYNIFGSEKRLLSKSSFQTRKGAYHV